MVLGPPKWVATTMEVASEAGEVTHMALATGVEGTMATATLAGAQEEEDTKVAQGEATEVAVVIVEEGIEEQVVAIEEATGIWGGVGGSYRSSEEFFHFD